MHAAATATLRTLARMRRPALPRRPAAPAHLGRWLIGLAAASLLAIGAYWFWFRDSSLVQVDKVTVEGLTTKDAPRVRKALVDAAKDMTTLHVRSDELARAVSAYPAIRSVGASADFPHALHLTVTEERPAALLESRDGEKVAVAPDGTVLEGVEGGRLPRVSLDAPVAGARLRDPDAQRYVAVAAAAPPPLAGEIAVVRERSGGDIVARLRGGPELVFGDTSRLDAKWSAAVSALAGGSTATAEYLDVRLPERPAAG